MFRTKEISWVQNFQCPECKKDKVREKRNGATLGRQIEEVQEFCYLGDALDCEAGVERAVRARVSAAWKKWREMAGLLTDKRTREDTRKCL